VEEALGCIGLQLVRSLTELKENTRLMHSLQHSCQNRKMPSIIDELAMNRAPSTESLAQVTKFERFLILNKKKLMLSSFLIAFVITAVMMPPSGHIPKSAQSIRLQNARTIGLCLFQYGQDHNGKYPAGTSSTDIFQQLIDQQYVTDLEIFYFAMPGKTKATTNKLKPENVCFDVTNAVLPDDPEALPIVFSTGYKIDYIQGGKAHLLANGDPNGVAVFFKDNSAAFLRAQPEGIPLFSTDFGPNTAPEFDPKGRTYRQLTPDGPLP
jgi:hypothetical protein